MFAGRFDHALDEKGRTMMPRRFRDLLAASGDRSVWIASPLAQDGHLEVRPATSFFEYLDRVSKLKQTELIEDFKRLYFGAALEVEVDSAGRILVPASKRLEIGLADKITFLGTDAKFFEIWHPEALDKRFVDVRGNNKQIRDHLREAGL